MACGRHHIKIQPWVLTPAQAASMAHHQSCAPQRIPTFPRSACAVHLQRGKDWSSESERCLQHVQTQVCPEDNKTSVPTHRTVPLASLQPQGFTASPPKLDVIL